MIKNGYPEKVGEGDSFWINQPFESKRSKQYGKQVSNWSENGPKGVNRGQKVIKVLKRGLEKKNDDDAGGDEDREDQSFWQDSPGVSKNPFSKIQQIFVADWRPF